MKIESIEVCGPFDFAIATDKEGQPLMLSCAGGEWRLSGLWIAQGRTDRWEALARACRRIVNGDVDETRNHHDGRLK